MNDASSGKGKQDPAKVCPAKVSCQHKVGRRTTGENFLFLIIGILIIFLHAFVDGKSMTGSFSRKPLDDEI